MKWARNIVTEYYDEHLKKAVSLRKSPTSTEEGSDLTEIIFFNQK